MESIVRDELLSVRDSLAAHAYPNFSSETSLRLVVDEAQILSDKGSELYQSSFMGADPRPIGEGVKEARSETFPYFEFPGWTDRDSIQSYIERVMVHLPDKESKNMLERLENKISQNSKDFTSCSSLRETLGLFLFRYCLLDATEIVLENEVQLVEAAFGRIKIFGGTARTVLDEPFVLKATFNYFREKDPSLVSAAERAMLHSDNASVHGNMWEACMPPVFVETFKSRPLLSWPLLTKTSLPDQLVGDVTIVGYDEQQPKLVVSHRNLTTQQFMKAHVENGSKQGDQDIPPFYFPAPHVSGPDIVFYVKINGNVYPVFVQLKLRQVLVASDAEKALATVSSRAIQEKMEREQEMVEKKQEKQHKQRQQESTTGVPSDQQQPPQLQDYCPTGKYISMVITYPAEVVNFQVVRPDPGPELEGLQRVSIGIDDNTFPKIFPRRHVEFLDKLKGHKRPPMRIRPANYTYLER
ncbi:hypothetical protein BGZ96_001335 [Linnemannia gamsii]|uniref:Uncharacterized protein n=1 Tax=Linnemannia gamsii TaxID=64522 RepID=A0ABQ7JMF2_9FUNG|nr:hypothetical protein BGZ96_001335 [Linnemannia gamsii]